MSVYMPPGTNLKSLPYVIFSGRSLRPLRHTILAAAILSISLSQNFSHYKPYGPVMGSGIYWLSLASWAAYLGIAYLHIYRLVPGYLARQKYRDYILLSVISVASLVLVRIGEDLTARIIWNVPVSDGPLYRVVMNYISDFATNMVCISGVSLTVLMKYLAQEENAVTELENRRLTAQVESLKDAADPEMLLSTLRRSGETAGAQPEQAAGMILMLSNLLRYQLYESSKEKIFLSSEIRFIGEYLELYKIRNRGFEYSLETTGSISGIYVPPLAFIPFIRDFIGSGSGKISIRFPADATGFTFECTATGAATGGNTTTALKRLGALYNGRLTHEEGTTENNGFIKIRIDHE